MKFSELFSAMLGHPEGRGRATPILAKNKFLYLKKNVCMEQLMTWKDYFKTFQPYSVNLRGVAGPYPFSKNVENVCITLILVSKKLCVGTWLRSP